MSFPPSHTIGAFLSEDAREISTVEKFEFTGFYEYHFQFNPSFVDVLFLKMKVCLFSFVFIFRVPNQFSHLKSRVISRNFACLVLLFVTLWCCLTTTLATL